MTSKPSAGGAPQHEHKGSSPAVDELPRERELARCWRRWCVLPDPDAFELVEGRVTGSFGAHDRHAKAGVSQRTRLQPHPPVPRDGLVLDDDEDSLARALQSAASSYQASRRSPGGHQRSRRHASSLGGCRSVCRRDARSTSCSDALFFTSRIRIERRLARPIRPVRVRRRRSTE